MIRRLAATLCFVVFATVAFAQGAQWQKLTEVWTRNDNAYTRGDWFANTHTGVYRPAGCSPGVWCTINVADYGIPTDAKSIFMAGIPIVSAGTTITASANLVMTCRAFGDTSSVMEADYPFGFAWYAGQAATNIGQHVVRNGFSTWCPVREGKFQVTYSVSPPGGMPLNPAFGVNMTIQAWGR